MASRGKGFSLVELIVVVAIMGVLLGLGLPAMSAYSRNIKLRAAAESFLAGLQQARGDAVRLNTRVEMILTNAAPIPDGGGLTSDYPVLEEASVNNLNAVIKSGLLAANNPTSHASSAADPSYNWLVRTMPTSGGTCDTNPGSDPAPALPDPVQQGKACWFLSARRGAEGAGSGSDSASPILIEGPASVSFSPLGGASAASTFNFSSPAGGSCAPSGPVRCLRVRVELGGRAKLCDPAATGPGDTRGC